MDTAVIDLAKVFSNLQKQVDRIRNICILAHVDHGKTTLADSLVASNGIISKRMAGKLRYMDCRADEQERGITMKSSSIALYYRRIGQQMENESRKDYLINLIDSPGHVDFSNEVSTAVRLCDGALLVVDVVEGVCPQTRACLQQIYEEQLKPILIFNKIDRLILEKQLTPLDAYYHMVQLLEQVNAALGSIFATDVMAKENLMNADNYESGLEHCDDSNLYFNPSTGNVIFCSACDGWGFTLHDFVSTYSKLLEIPTEELQNNLWGDFYYNGKKKCVTAGAQAKAKKPMFVQFVLENIWNLYDIIAIKRDKEKIPIIAQKLHIVVHNRDIRGNDVRLQLKLILGQWLPIERTVLEMVIKHMPAPIHMTKERAQNLLFNRNANLNSYPEESLQLIDDFVKCDANSDRIVIFVSKMSIVPVTQLPHLKPKRLTQEELKAKRNEVVKRLEEKHRREAGEIAQELQNVITGVEKLTIKGNEEEHLEQQQQEQKRHCDLPASDNLKNKEEPLLSRDHIHEAVENVDSAYNVQKVEIEEKSNFEFIAFARIFSGTVRKGQKLYSLTPKHDPRNHNHMNLDSSYITEVTIGDLYVFMGAELLAVDEVPSGNIVGIGGLEQYIIKTGTLSNTIFCSAFSELNCTAQPILRIAIEAENPSQMPQLIKGLKMLNQADACVHVSIETNGEHVITTLGEVHAEKCIRDLEENYAKCKVHVSEPIVSFRETIVPESHKDMVNEIVTKKISNEKTLDKKIVRMQTTDKMCTIKVIALPLPQQIIDIFEKYQRFFSDLHAMNITTATTTTGPSATAMITRTSISNKSQQIIMQIRRQLVQAFAESFDGQGVVQLSDKELLDCIWSLGPKHCGSNILLNLTDYKQPDFWQIQSNRLNYINDDGNQLLMDKRHHYNNAFINGFQITTLNGPLCEEPMQGVCFVVLEWSLAETFNEDFNCKSFGPFSGQLLNAVKDACRQAFLNQPQRLVTPIYTCNIIVNSDVLGKMYAVLGKRHGKIVSADLMQGSGNFFVTAMLPVIGSFNFAQEIRKQTSGLAYPQLVFSHWEVIDIDPFWVPTTEEEFTHFGEKADSVNRAKLYMNRVRRRKGLPVDDKVVEHAEKQRTLAKKK